MTSSETTFNDEELIERLRAVCTCNIDSTPCMAEDDCRDALAAAARIEQLVATNEALTKERDQHWDSFVHWHKQADDLTGQLAAARRDAEIAEEELELQEEEACMMENSYFELEKELNTCRMAQAVMDNTVADLEAKLAKAVEALEPFARAAETWEPDDGDSGLGARIEHPHHGLERHAEFTFGDLRRARATLAELKGETHDPL